MKYKLLVLAMTLISAFSCVVHAQDRDYLTDEEIELIRDAQQIDKRIDVLVHAIDRRFAALNINVSSPVRKDGPEWGVVPEGTRLQLLYDIKRILQKSIDDIDNLSERPSSMVIDETVEKKKQPTYSDIFPRAVRSLAAAAERYRVPLRIELDKAGDGSEKGSILAALDMCGEITAAAEKLPKATEPVKKKGS